MFPDFDFASVFDSLKYVFSSMKILTNAFIDFFTKLYAYGISVFKYINGLPR